MTDGTLLRAVRHNSWANQQLVAFCARLTEAQRAWSVPGTFGSIHADLQHILGAEGGYLLSLTGEPPPGGPVPPAPLVPFERLAPLARSNAERILRLLGSAGFDPERVIQRRHGTATAAVIVAQFIHHGSDHRAHVGTILGANGVEPPDLDVWAYGLTTGEVVES